jgi:hypothetical protein
VRVMNNKVRLNRRLFTTSTFDSGALGVLASVVHQFPAGHYYSVVRREGQNAGSTRFLVEKSSTNMQLKIDLVSVGAPKEEVLTAAAIPTVSPKGYVLFYVSGGAGGYSVVAQEEGDATPVFDSTTLSGGDLFAVSPLEPATYSMANQVGNITGEIQVTLMPEGTDLRTLPTQYVDVNSANFDPAKVSIHSAQGLVFRIKSPARVVINKQKGEELATAVPKGKRVRRRVRLRRSQ